MNTSKAAGDADEQMNPKSLVGRFGGFFDRSLLYAISSAFLAWAAFAPLQWSFLIWIVPALWGVLIQRPIPRNSQTSIDNSGVFYLKIWIAGTVFWLLSFSWMYTISGPWPKALWIAGAMLLSLFWVLNIGLSRAAVHGLKLPLIVGAPLVWCGLEWIRKNWFFGGFSYGALEHSQYQNSAVIQIADICGEYGVGILIVFVGSCVGRFLTTSEANCGRGSPVLRVLNSKGCAVVGSFVAFIFVGAYANLRSSVGERNLQPFTATAPTRIALLQGNIDAGVEEPPEVAELLAKQRLEQYESLSQMAATDAEYVVWPEDTILAWYDFPSDYIPDYWRGQPAQTISEMVKQTRIACDKPLVELAEKTQANLLLGLKTLEFASGKDIVSRNSAVMIDRLNGIGPRYDKVNLAPFIEGNPWPWLIPNRFVPGAAFVAGDRISGFPIRVVHNEFPNGSRDDEAAQSSEQLWAAVNLCFDGSFPHFVRRQLGTVVTAGHTPDIVINLSNTGSCRFSSMSHLQLATSVFRAVENRRPFLSASNAGFAAWIDSRGRIIKIGESGKATYVVAEVSRESATSLYRSWGDSIPIGCLGFNILVVVLGVCKKLSFGPQFGKSATS